MPRADLTAHLSRTYGEAMAGVGLRDPQSVLELWVSHDGATWTLVLSMASGMACVMAAGTGWLGVERPEAVQRVPGVPG